MMECHLLPLLSTMVNAMADDYNFETDNAARRQMLTKWSSVYCTTGLLCTVEGEVLRQHMLIERWLEMTDAMLSAAEKGIDISDVYKHR